MKRVLNKIEKRIRFRKDLKFFIKKSNDSVKRFSLNKADFYRCMDDNTQGTGFDRHYVYQVAWASRFLYNKNTKHHVDISSTLFLCGSVSAFCEVDFYDFRPAKIELSNLTSRSADLTKLHFETNSLKSLSCLHTVEHIGLGRYGDPFDYDGDLKAIKELSRVLAVGGDLLFVVPIGSESRIQFNAHRIYTKEQVVDYFKQEGLKLKEFTLIPENEKDGGLIENPSDELLSEQRYACGCFVFTK
jgi:hypothetical protein